MKVFQAINVNTNNRKIMQVLDKGWRDYYRLHGKPPKTLNLSWNLLCFILVKGFHSNKETMFLCDVVQIKDRDDLFCFE